MCSMRIHRPGIAKGGGGGASNFFLKVNDAQQHALPADPHGPAEPALYESFCCEMRITASIGLRPNRMMPSLNIHGTLHLLSQSLALLRHGPTTAM